MASTAISPALTPSMAEATTTTATTTTPSTPATASVPSYLKLLRDSIVPSTTETQAQGDLDKFVVAGEYSARGRGAVWQLRHVWARVLGWDSDCVTSQQVRAHTHTEHPNTPSALSHVSSPQPPPADLLLATPEDAGATTATDAQEARLHHQNELIAATAYRLRAGRRYRARAKRSPAASSAAVSLASLTLCIGSRFDHASALELLVKRFRGCSRITVPRPGGGVQPALRCVSSCYLVFTPPVCCALPSLQERHAWPALPPPPMCCKPCCCWLNLPRRQQTGSTTSPSRL